MLAAEEWAMTEAVDECPQWCAADSDGAHHGAHDPRRTILRLARLAPGSPGVVSRHGYAIVWK